MEVSVFPRLEPLLRNFVEIRLHTDTGTDAREFAARQVAMTGSNALPIYLVIDPKQPDRILDRADGAFADRIEALLRKHSPEVE